MALTPASISVDKVLERIKIRKNVNDKANDLLFQIINFKIEKLPGNVEYISQRAPSGNVYSLEHAGNYILINRHNTVMSDPYFECEEQYWCIMPDELKPDQVYLHEQYPPADLLATVALLIMANERKFLNIVEGIDG